MHDHNNPFTPETDHGLVPAQVIHKPRTVKHPWRTEGEPFDPARVARTGLVAVTEPSKPAIS